MSKNRYTNYQNMSANVEPKTVPNPIEPVEDTVVEDVIEETVEDVVENEPAKESVKEATKTPETNKPSNVGVVSECAALRVRKAPSLAAGVVCTIKESTAVVIDEKNSTTEFYKVCTEAGIEGYCMKKFITVKA